MRLVCALGLFLALLHLSSSLLLGAFNIRAFGPTKASKPHVMDIISTIVQRYDIVLIQEVRDTDLSATQTLMNLINRGPNQYGYVVSDLLGPSTYKERYLFIYRTQMVSVAASYTYANTGTNTFSRPPFIVMFSSPNTAVKDFVLIPQHTSPPSAVKEIDLLYDVVTDVRTRWKTNNIVLLGDFNAGCTYVRNADWQNIRLFTDKSFTWLIGNNVDTTVSGSNCPYDRIVVTAAMLPVVVPNSAVVYNFRAALSPETRVPPVQSSDVSDHFPVEVQLR